MVRVRELCQVKENVQNDPIWERESALIVHLRKIRRGCRSKGHIGF